MAITDLSKFSSIGIILLFSLQMRWFFLGQAEIQKTCPNNFRKVEDEHQQYNRKLWQISCHQQTGSRQSLTLAIDIMVTEFAVRQCVERDSPARCRHPFPNGHKCFSRSDKAVESSKQQNSSQIYITLFVNSKPVEISVFWLHGSCASG